VTVGELWNRVGARASGRLHARLDLAQVPCLQMPGMAAPAHLDIPCDTHIEANINFDALSGPTQVRSGDVIFTRPIVITNPGDLQGGTGGVARWLANHAASYELRGLRFRQGGGFEPIGTVLLFKRFATHRFDQQIQQSLEQSARQQACNPDSLLQTVDALSPLICRGAFSVDMSSGVDRDSLIDAGKLMGGNETYITVNRQPLDAHLHGTFSHARDGFLVCLEQPVGHTLVSDMLRLDVVGTFDVGITRRGSARRLCLSSSQTHVRMHRVDIPLRDDPKAPQPSARIVGGTAWRPRTNVPAADLYLNRLAAKYPGLRHSRAALQANVDLALSLVEPLNPEQVLGAHGENIAIAYKGSRGGLNADGEIILSQPPPEPDQPPFRMRQKIKIMNGKNLSPASEPIEEGSENPPALLALRPLHRRRDRRPAAASESAR
ncbi:MAG TPA: hypothetical protein VFH51_04085, partial [Myxococcota bacterium]|nr:hypothetical protein [Myxococcota bacterium]